ncbi:hypothetical protein ABE61_00840 [Lysinibacillus sphaericus]|nr:hypothetical protein [Lysinibacillus sphaericus]
MVSKEADGKVNYIQIYVGQCLFAVGVIDDLKNSREKGHSFLYISTNDESTECTYHMDNLWTILQWSVYFI